MDEPILPQRPARSRAEVFSVEWLFEPSWPGDRCVVHVRDGRVERITDAAGDEADGERFGDAPEVIGPAILAGEAVVDGVWSVQPFVGDGSPARAWAETLDDEGLRSELPDPIESERRRAFIAVDLIAVDGEDLTDVPFQERRRLLESIIDEGVRVRLSPVVKQPLGGWLVGWRANGFVRYIAKHMNSRYTPGEENPDWIEIPVNAPVPKGMVGRLFGGRGERTRRIRD